MIDVGQQQEVRRGVDKITGESFSRLVVRHEKLVYTVCLQLVRDPGTAEDLAQETFLSAYLHRDAMPPGYERQWLCRIAANKARDYLQSAWHRHTCLPGEDHLPPGQAPPAEEAVLRRAGAEEIAALIDGLGEPYRPVCRLCLLAERTPEEAALALGRPVKTVYTQLSRGRKLLREALERSGNDDMLSP